MYSACSVRRLGWEFLAVIYSCLMKTAMLCFILHSPRSSTPHLALSECCQWDHNDWETRWVWTWTSGTQSYAESITTSTTMRMRMGARNQWGGWRPQQQSENVFAGGQGFQSYLSPLPGSSLSEDVMGTERRQGTPCGWDILHTRTWPFSMTHPSFCMSFNEHTDYWLNGTCISKMLPL